MIIHYNQNRISNEASSMHQPVDTVDMLEEFMINEYGKNFLSFFHESLIPFMIMSSIKSLRLIYEYQDRDPIIDDRVYDYTSWFQYYDFLESIEEEEIDSSFV